MTRVDAQLVIIGTGPLEQSLRNLCSELGVHDRVSFAGFVTREEQRRLFHAARVFVLPSVTVAEAFGIAQLEAMCCARPVVNTQLSSTVPLVARHRQEALTVEPGNAEGLAAAIGELLDDPDLAARLGHGGQARARANFGYPSYAARVINAYREATEERAAGTNRSTGSMKRWGPRSTVPTDSNPTLL
jgi:rhamnosyl/mannosyltransferase